MLFVLEKSELKIICWVDFGRFVCWLVVGGGGLFEMSVAYDIKI